MMRSITIPIFFLALLTAFSIQLNAQCDVNGGDLTTSGGMTEKPICAGDGISDAFDVLLDNVTGSNSAWVITDDALNILALPPAPPFDLEGAGPGTCLIWHLSFEGELTGVAVGQNAADIQGCYDLSNPITVERTGVNGGELSLPDGSTEVIVCAGDGVSDAFDVVLTGAEGPNDLWILTDENDIIQRLPFKPPFDFEGSASGVYLLYNISFVNGVMGIERGKNINDVEGCNDISNAIRIEVNGVNGGWLRTAGGMVEKTICAGDGESDAFGVMLTKEEGSNSAWVITDEALNILGLPPAPPFDLEGAGIGTCLIWHLSYENEITGLEMGANAADLAGCYSLSNPITVIRNNPIGGNLTTAGGMTEKTICAGDGVSDAFDVILTDEQGANSGWIITDDELNILGLPPAPPFDLEGAGIGVCLIWHVSSDGELGGVEVGKNAADITGCYSLSNAITVTRNNPIGGNLTTSGGMTEKEICAGDGNSDAFDVILTGEQGANSAWVITDDALNILALPPAPPFDLEGAGEGVCLIWHLSFDGEITGAEVGLNAADLEGCYSLSNPITVDRTEVRGGDLSFPDGTTEFGVCNGQQSVVFVDVVLENEAGPSDLWVITDENDIIKFIPFKPPFDFSRIKGSVSKIYNVSFVDGVQGIVRGKNINDLEGCFDLSNPVTVIKDAIDLELNGGNLTTSGGMTEKEICAGDGVSDAFDVILTDENGSNSAWVITDEALNILGLPPAPPFDLEGAGSGTCLIWHLSYEDGIQGLEMGANAGDFTGCFDLSNPITVIRNGVAGGTLTLADGDTARTICAGDGIPDPFAVNLTGNEGSNLAWVITDEALNILGLPAAPPFDLEGAGEGVCLVWSLSYEDGLEGLEMGANAGDFVGCYALSNPITITRNGVAGGNITTSDGMTELTICAGDGESDAFDVTLTDNSGDNSAWVITDEALNILGLPAAPPFDLEGAGEGVCLVWHLSYADGLEGLEMGANAGDFVGCYDLSNPITVNRNGVNGGELATAGGMTELTICAGDGESDAFDVTLTGNEGERSRWVITDDALNILALPDAPPFDLEGAGEGICLVWHLSFERGLTGLIVGRNAADFEGCYSLSNPITVNRIGVMGGELTLGDGTTEKTICAGDGESDAFGVILSGNEGANSAWVITDEALNILGLPAAPPFDLEGAGDGTCLVWHLSYEDGLEGLEMGANAGNFVGCYALSNAVTIFRNGVNGGELAIADGSTELRICAGDGESDAFDVSLTGTEGSNSAWVITDEALNILGLPAAPPFDLEGAGEGVCLVWHLSFEDGLEGLEMGANAGDFTGCYDLSNPITVIRNGVEGGEIATTDGLTELTICAGDGESDAFDVTLTGNAGENSRWVITDEALNILGLPAAPPFDLEGAGEGVCLIWNLSFQSGLQGVQMGANVGDFEGCYDLSNPITVIRNGVVGGELTTGSGETEISICAGDGVSDAFGVILSGNEGANTSWIITDDALNILALPAAPPFDLEGAGPGTCLIWSVSYEDGIEGLEVGANAGDLSGCFALSNAITVVRTRADGGMVSLSNGDTETSICAGNGVSDSLFFFTTSEDASYGYIITDDSNNVLGLPSANVQDFEGAGQGICRVWGVSFTGNLTVQQGDNIDGLSLSDECFDLSSNFIEVVRDTSGAVCTTGLTQRARENNLGVIMNPEYVKVMPYPNPTEGNLMLNITLEQQERGMQLEVLDLFGRIVLSQDIEAGLGAFNQELNVNNLPEGQYWIKLYNDKWITTTRFVKQ